MIFITGDIHGDPDRFSVDEFPAQNEMTREDYVIICGDFGMLWSLKENKEENEQLDWLNDRNFTTLFIDGNHENFDRLNALPVRSWHGGNVHVVRENVIHLTQDEMDTGLENLKKHNMQVDFIVSHDGPISDLVLLGGGITADPLNKYFEELWQTVTYRKWFFGHHHEDQRINDRETAIYYSIMQVE